MRSTLRFLLRSVTRYRRGQILSAPTWNRTCMKLQKLRKVVESQKIANSYHAEYALLGPYDSRAPFESDSRIPYDHVLQARKDRLRRALANRSKSLRDKLEGNFTNTKGQLHQVINTSREQLQDRKSEIEKTIREKRELLQDAIQTQKDRLRETEQKFAEQKRMIIQDIRETKEKMLERMEEMAEKENIYTIPNLLCVTRIVFSPLLGYLIVAEHFNYALVFMIFAGVSDWCDGYIARNFESQSSKIGSFLDPMADKILIGTLFLSLTYVNLIPVPLTALIVGRDLVLVTAGFVIRYKSLTPPRTLSRYFDATHATAQLAPTTISKINTGIQLALVGTMLAAPVFDYTDHPILTVLCYITAASTIVSAGSYLTKKDTYKYFRNKK